MRKKLLTNDLLAYLLIFLIGLSLSSIYTIYPRPEHLPVTGLSQGVVMANIVPLGALSAPSLEIHLNPDNMSSNLNWTYIAQADYYLVYYSSNISQIQNLDPYSIPVDVVVVNVSDINWTDFQARDVNYRYYRVASVKDSLKNISRETVGTCYLKLVKGKNLISLCMNATYSAESFMQKLSWTTNRPSVLKLDRPSEPVESWASKTLGFGTDYRISDGKGYLLSLDKTYNYTIVGYAFEDPFTLNLIRGKNQLGIDGHKAYSAENFLSGISWSTNRPSLLKLDRPSELTESWLSKTLGYGTDYSMFIGRGYLLSLDKNFNYTLQ